MFARKFLFLAFIYWLITLSLQFELSKKHVHENGIKEFTVKNVIKGNQCSCACVCIPPGVTSTGPLPTPEKNDTNIPGQKRNGKKIIFLSKSKQKHFLEYTIVKEIKGNLCDCACTCLPKDKPAQLSPITTTTFIPISTSTQWIPPSTTTTSEAITPTTAKLFVTPSTTSIFEIPSSTTATVYLPKTSTTEFVPPQTQSTTTTPATQTPSAVPIATTTITASIPTTTLPLTSKSPSTTSESTTEKAVTSTTPLTTIQSTTTPILSTSTSEVVTSTTPAATTTVTTTTKIPQTSQSTTTNSVPQTTVPITAFPETVKTTSSMPPTSSLPTTSEAITSQSTTTTTELTNSSSISTIPIIHSTKASPFFTFSTIGETEATTEIATTTPPLTQPSTTLKHIPNDLQNINTDEEDITDEKVLEVPNSIKDHTPLKNNKKQEEVAPSIDENHINADDNDIVTTTISTIIEKVITSTEASTIQAFETPASKTIVPSTPEPSTVLPATATTELTPTSEATPSSTIVLSTTPVLPNSTAATETTIDATTEFIPTNVEADSSTFSTLSPINSTILLSATSENTLTTVSEATTVLPTTETDSTTSVTNAASNVTQNVFSTTSETAQNVEVLSTLEHSTVFPSTLISTVLNDKITATTFIEDIAVSSTKNFIVESKDGSNSTTTLTSDESENFDTLKSSTSSTTTPETSFKNTTLTKLEDDSSEPTESLETSEGNSQYTTLKSKILTSTDSNTISSTKNIISESEDENISKTTLNSDDISTLLTSTSETILENSTITESVSKISETTKTAETLKNNFESTTFAPANPITLSTTDKESSFSTPEINETTSEIETAELPITSTTAEADEETTIISTTSKKGAITSTSSETTIDVSDSTLTLTTEIGITIKPDGETTSTLVKSTTSEEDVDDSTTILPVTSTISDTPAETSTIGSTKSAEEIIIFSTMPTTVSEEKESTLTTTEASETSQPSVEPKPAETDAPKNVITDEITISEKATSPSTLEELEITTEAAITDSTTLQVTTVATGSHEIEKIITASKSSEEAQTSSETVSPLQTSVQESKETTNQEASFVTAPTSSSSESSDEDLLSTATPATTVRIVNPKFKEKVENLLTRIREQIAKLKRMKASTSTLPPPPPSENIIDGGTGDKDIPKEGEENKVDSKVSVEDMLQHFKESREKMSHENDGTTTLSAEITEEAPTTESVSTAAKTETIIPDFSLETALTYATTAAEKIKTDITESSTIDITLEKETVKTTLMPTSPISSTKTNNEGTFVVTNVQSTTPHEIDITTKLQAKTDVEEMLTTVNLPDDAEITNAATEISPTTSDFSVSATGATPTEAVTDAEKETTTINPLESTTISHIETDQITNTITSTVTEVSAKSPFVAESNEDTTIHKIETTIPQKTESIITTQAVVETTTVETANINDDKTTTIKKLENDKTTGKVVEPTTISTILIIEENSLPTETTFAPTDGPTKAEVETTQILISSATPKQEGENTKTTISLTDILSTNPAAVTEAQTTVNLDATEKEIPTTTSITEPTNFVSSETTESSTSDERTTSIEVTTLPTTTVFEEATDASKAIIETEIQKQKSTTIPKIVIASNLTTNFAQNADKSKTTVPETTVSSASTEIKEIVTTVPLTADTTAHTTTNKVEKTTEEVRPSETTSTALESNPSIVESTTQSTISIPSSTAKTETTTESMHSEPAFATEASNDSDEESFEAVASVKVENAEATAASLLSPSDETTQDATTTVTSTSSIEEATSLKKETTAQIAETTIFETTASPIEFIEISTTPKISVTIAQHISETPTTESHTTLKKTTLPESEETELINSESKETIINPVPSTVIITTDQVTKKTTLPESEEPEEISAETIGLEITKTSETTSTTSKFVEAQTTTPYSSSKISTTEIPAFNKDSTTIAGSFAFVTEAEASTLSTLTVTPNLIVTEKTTAFAEPLKKITIGFQHQTEEVSTVTETEPVLFTSGSEITETARKLTTPTEITVLPTTENPSTITAELKSSEETESINQSPSTKEATIQTTEQATMLVTVESTVSTITQTPLIEASTVSQTDEILSTEITKNNLEAETSLESSTLSKPTTPIDSQLSIDDSGLEPLFENPRFSNIRKIGQSIIEQVPINVEKEGKEGKEEENAATISLWNKNNIQDGKFKVINKPILKSLTQSNAWENMIEQATTTKPVETIDLGNILKTNILQTTTMTSKIASNENANTRFVISDELARRIEQVCFFIFSIII
uniref:Uncharacterized protein n=1 Tax=Panagrolaimus davidi TaxID=227884 RepID=A0A914QEF5_9BILA